MNLEEVQIKPFTVAIIGHIYTSQISKELIITQMYDDSFFENLTNSTMTSGKLIFKKYYLMWFFDDKILHSPHFFKD